MKPPETVDSPPLLANRYMLDRLLGTGGMGAVYRAHDSELDEWVALKLLRPELLSDPDNLSRFRQEVKLARRVTHPQVARVFDMGEDGGRRFLTMELIDGESLATRLQRTGPPGTTNALLIVRAVLQGLAAVHAAGVVHRDLKPDNVLVTGEGRVVITDFGVARTLRTGEGLAKSGGLVLGTPEYMAPEQVDDRGSVDARADLYAVGAILFELLTGRRAWQGPTPLAVMVARLLQAPPDPRSIRPEIPGPLAELVLRLLARDRDQRPGSAEEVVAAIERLQPGAPTAMLPPVEGHTPRRGGEVRLAVLPVHNMLGPQDEHLALGLTHELIEALAGAPGLRVVPRTHGEATGDARGDRLSLARNLGRALGIHVLVDASLSGDTNDHRLTMRLLSTDDGFQFWSRRYAGARGELLKMAGTAANDVSVALTAGPPRRSIRSLTDPEALDLYLRARKEYHAFWRDAVERSVTLFDQALVRVPDDPLVLAGAALARARKVALAVGDPEDPARVRDMAERALARSPALGEARVALATLEMNLGDPVIAAQEVRRALQDAPAQADAHEIAGRLLLESGPIMEAIRELEAAVRFEPALRAVRTHIARGFALVGRWDDAWERLEEPELDATHRNLYEISRSRLALWSGNQLIAKDIEATADGFELVPAARHFARLVLTGQLSDDALGELEGMARMAGAPPRLRSFFNQLRTEVFCALGRLDEAEGTLRESVDEGLFDRSWLVGCPLLARLRERPGWAGVHETVEARAQALRVALLGEEGLV